MGGIPGFGERTRLDTSMEASSPFGSLKRTGPASANLHGPASPWGPAAPQSAGFGAFGNFALDANATPSTPGEKRPGFGSMRSESRFKGLMSKDSSEDIARPRERTPSLLERLGETESDRQIPSQWTQASGIQSRDRNQIEDFDQQIGNAGHIGDDVSSVWDIFITHQPGSQLNMLTQTA